MLRMRYLGRLVGLPSPSAVAGLLCLLALPVASAGAETSPRVVTLAPHITEMVFAAGAGPTLVGTVISSDHPQRARTLPKVGDGATHISMERLAALAPSLVLAWQDSGAVAAAAPILHELGIPLEFVTPARLDDIPDYIERLGSRLGTPLQAREAAAEKRAELQALRHRYARRPPVSVFIEVGHVPLYAAGSDPLLNDALETCGGINIFADSQLAALPVGPEHILSRHPDVIIVAQAGRQRTQQAAKRWAALGLGTGSTRLYNIDPDTLFRPGPRLLDATRNLCEMLEDARTNAGHQE